jgi:hypothetical protein
MAYISRMACMNRLKLSTAFLALVCVATAHADPNSAARVRIFASLPDWTGLWQSAAWPIDVSGRVPGGEAKLREGLQLIRHPPYNAEWEAKFQEGMKNTAALAAQSATFTACTRGFPAIMEGPMVFQIVVSPEETLLVFESQQVRHIYTDGRRHPPAEDLWPTRLGDSIGRWKGDTLIVDTVARNAEPIAPRAWLSILSDQAHFTERLRLVNRNKVEDQVTIEDPIAFARPWHMVLEFTRVPGMNRMIAYDCTENERNPVVDGKMTITVPP